MICFLWESVERGVMVKPSLKPYTNQEIVRMCGVDNDNSDIWLTLLEEAEVFSRRDDGAIFSRRMVRDEEKRQKWVHNGKKGGNPHLLDNPMVNQPVNQIPEDENENEDEDSIGISSTLNGPVTPPAPKEKAKRKPMLEKAVLDAAVERVYNLYPTTDKNNGGRSTGKSLKDKIKIRTILVEGTYPLEMAISLKLLDVKRTGEWLSYFGTFLNNLPGLDVVEEWRVRYEKKAAREREQEQKARIVEIPNTPEEQAEIARVCREAIDKIGRKVA